VNNTSVPKYWKILFYPPNTDTGTFYGGSTDIDTDAQYPKFNTDILVFPVFYTIIKYFYRILILEQYFVKSHTGNHTSVCFQYWYSVFCLGAATYTAA